MRGENRKKFLIIEFMNKEKHLQLYPLTILMITFTVILSAFIVPSKIYGYFTLIIFGIIVYFFGHLKDYLKRVFVSLFFLILTIFIIQSIFIPSEEILMKIGFISIYKDGVLKAISLTSKISAVVGAFSMFFIVTPIKEFSKALEQKGLNPKGAFIITSALQMIPEMKKQAAIIMDSQKSRGVETEGNVFVIFKALLPVFIPLVLSSIVNTEERAITLEARGFSIGKKRTILNELEETKNDKIVKIILIIFIILCIIWRVLWVLK